MIRRPLARPSRIALALFAVPCFAFAQAAASASAPALAEIPPRSVRTVCPPLDYPPAAMRAGATGRSIVRARATSDGTLLDAHLVRQSGLTREHALLDAAAVVQLARCHLEFEASSPKVSVDRTIVIVFAWKLDNVPFSTIDADAATLADLHGKAEAGDAAAAYTIYQRTPYRPETVDDAIHWLAFAADHGNVGAQYELGRLHLHGEGVALDLARTGDLWRQASEHGNEPAMRGLVAQTLDATSPLHDAARGIALLKRAAADERGWALLQLGDLDAAGEGVPRDDRAAIDLWRRAVNKYQAAGLLRIAQAYASGRGVRQDAVLAGTYALIAQAKNVPTASDVLAGLQLDDATLKKAGDRAQQWRHDGERELPD